MQQKGENMNEVKYVLSGTWLSLKNGEINMTKPVLFQDKKAAEAVLRQTYDHFREQVFHVPDAIADENGDSIEGGYCGQDEACIYANAEFACDCLVQVACFVITEM